MPTDISWADETWNPSIGCTKVSAGCRACYAEVMAGRIATMANSAGESYRKVTTVQGWNGTTHVVESAMDKPLRWKKPRMVFVCSMSDLFHETVSDETINRVFAVMAMCPQHTFQVLTKRPERMWHYLAQWFRNGLGMKDRIGFTIAKLIEQMPANKNTERICDAFDLPLLWPLPNVWIGTSVENQEKADERIPHLVNTPAAVRFLSVEPMLTDIDLPFRYHPGAIDWVIFGVESKGRGVGRWCDPEWIRSAVRQCRAHDVAPFVKQLHVEYAHEAHGRLVKTMADFPEDLRIQEFPQEADSV